MYASGIVVGAAVVVGVAVVVGAAVVVMPGYAANTSESPVSVAPILNANVA